MDAPIDDRSLVILSNDLNGIGALTSGGSEQKMEQEDYDHQLIRVVQKAIGENVMNATEIWRLDQQALTRLKARVRQKLDSSK